MVQLLNSFLGEFILGSTFL